MLFAEVDRIMRERIKADDLKISPVSWYSKHYYVKDIKHMPGSCQVFVCMNPVKQVGGMPDYTFEQRQMLIDFKWQRVHESEMQSASYVLSDGLAKIEFIPDKVNHDIMDVEVTPYSVKGKPKIFSYGATVEEAISDERVQRIIIEAIKSLKKK